MKARVNPLRYLRHAWKARDDREAVFHSSAFIRGCLIEHVHPLKASGFAKSGNISLTGIHEGRKVKLSSMFTRQQVVFRKSLTRLSQDIALPKLIAFDDRFIVEEWIEGTSPGRLDRAGRGRLRTAIRDFVYGNDRYEWADRDRCGFDYLDYLGERVASWHFIRGVPSLLEQWRAQREALCGGFRLALSNPDLSFQNFVIQNESGRIFLIDNEYLHVGEGGFMDFFNSAIRHEAPQFDASPEMQTFFRNTVRLRQVGSALVTGHPESIRADMLELEIV